MFGGSVVAGIAACTTCTSDPSELMYKDPHAQVLPLKPFMYAPCLAVWDANTGNKLAEWCVCNSPEIELSPHETTVVCSPCGAKLAYVVTFEMGSTEHLEEGFLRHVRIAQW